jgi:predicted ATPase/class 3 adenylate cyclase
VGGPDDGHRVTGVAGPRPASSLPTGTVTFLFSDVEGSTRLVTALGPRFPAVLDRHHAILRDAFGEAGGVEVGTEGDAFFVVFRAPGDAVRGAVAAQRALAAEPWPEGVAVRVRMGIHTGEGALGGDNYAGLDVHRAARIAAAAHGGQVLLSGATHALVAGTTATGPGDVTFRDLGDHRLKDLDRPERLVQLVVDGLATDFPAPRSLEVPSNLPVQVTAFVGRERELGEVAELLGRARLVTLTGPGGTGKTRLSIAVAERCRDGFPDGVFFVELAPITEPALIAATVASAMGVREDPSRPVAETLRDHLGNRHVLLVLDNLEQVIAGAPVVAGLLRAASRLGVLASSRELLGVAGEHQYPVPPLGAPDTRHLPPLDELARFDAVALFVDRARAARAGFELTEANAAAVAAICARLDGLPLAIELAAARIRLFAPDALLRRLDQRLAVLTGGGRDLPVRQQTLRGAIDWSHDLLDPVERVLFRRLAPFSGGASIEAVAAVCDPDGTLGIDPVDGLASLVDKSLLRIDEDARAEPRFRMLETIREYAAERLAESEDAEAVPRRHAEAFARLAADAEPRIVGAEQAAWLDRLDQELDNLRAALAWAADHDLPLALATGGALWRFWHQRSHLGEGRALLAGLLDRPGAAAPSAARAKALDGLGGIAYWQVDFPAAKRAYAEQLAISRALGEPRRVAEALYNLGFVANILGETDDGRRVHEEALAIYESLGDDTAMAMVREGLVFYHLSRGEWAIGREIEAANLRTFRGAGDRLRLAGALQYIAVFDQFLGRFAEARAELAEAAAIFRTADDLPNTINTLAIAAATAVSAGDAAVAARILGAIATQQATVGEVATVVDLLKIPDPGRGARELLGDGAFERELALGRALSLDEAIHLAVHDATADA